MEFRKIGVLTSGGDAPGMNAAVRSVTLAALAKGVKVMGIYGGYSGLINDNMIELTPANVAGTINLGGTVLYSDRCVEFKTEEGMQKAIATCRKNGIDGIVAIGGDGTFRGATDLSFRGIPTIGVPGTIDNDITSTDASIGFDTAMNTVLEMIDRLRDTSESHARCMVVEVMGRNAGYIALECGISLGAIGVAIREVDFDENALCEKMKARRAEGARSFVVVVAEGVIPEGEKDYCEKLTKRIEAATGVESRFCRLGHVVRGGIPTLRDRLLASRMGECAVECLLRGESDLVICERHGVLTPMNIGFALILDRMFKGKLKDGDLDKFSEEDVAKMRAICEEKMKDIRDMYSVAETLAM